MTTKPKKEKFSDIKNSKSKMEVIKGKVIDKKELLPETKTMVPVKEFAKPLVTAEEAMQSFQQYQELINALIKQSDIVEIQGKQRIKKTGINKIARFFGVSTEIIRHHREDSVGPQGGKTFTWYIWVKAWLPSGQSRVDGAACSSSERRFAHLENDVLATAITRATKRAIEHCVGMGEYESAEESESQAPATSRTTPEQAPEMPIQGESDVEKKERFDKDEIPVIEDDPKGTKISLEEENPEFHHPLPSEEQLKWVRIILEQLHWKIPKSVDLLTKIEAKSIIDRGFAAAKRRKIKLVESK